MANCLLVRAGRPQQKLTYNADVGGRRGRVAVGLTKDTWITYGASDGSSGAMTPEELRDYMAGQGCQFAVMMDGGGKVNLYVKSENVLKMCIRDRSHRPHRSGGRKRCGLLQ